MDINERLLTRNSMNANPQGFKIDDAGDPIDPEFDDVEVPIDTPVNDIDPLGESMLGADPAGDASVSETLDVVGDMGQGLLKGTARGFEQINKAIPGLSFIQDQFRSLFDFLGIDSSIDEPTTLPGKLVEGVGQALPGIIPAVKIARTLVGTSTAIKRIGAEVIGGTIGDFFTSGTNEAEGLVELIKLADTKTTDRIVTALEEFLAEGKDDPSEFRARVLGSVPGAILGPLLEPLIEVGGAVLRSGKAKEAIDLINELKRDESGKVILSTDGRGLVPAVKDPVTGKVFTGPNHGVALNNALEGTVEVEDVVPVPEVHRVAKEAKKYLEDKWGVSEETNSMMNLLDLSTNREGGHSAYLRGPFGEIRISDHAANPNFVTSNVNMVNPSLVDVKSMIDRAMDARNKGILAGNTLLDAWEAPRTALSKKSGEGWKDDFLDVRRATSKEDYQARKAAFLEKHGINNNEFNTLLKPRPNRRRMELTPALSDEFGDAPIEGFIKSDGTFITREVANAPTATEAQLAGMTDKQLVARTVEEFGISETEAANMVALERDSLIKELADDIDRGLASRGGEESGQAQEGQAQTRLPAPVDVSIEQPTDTTFSAQKDGKEIGRLSISPAGPFVSPVSVVEAHRRQGVATLLYDAAEKSLGRRLIPSPLGLSDATTEFWKKRLAALPPAEARALVQEAIDIGDQEGIGADTRTRFSAMLTETPISRVEPEAQSPAMVKAIEEGDFPSVIRQAADEEQIKLTEKASRGLDKLPVQLDKGDPNIPRVFSESFDSRLDDEGREFMKWVKNNPKGKFLHKNGKTNASIDFSTTCARRSCSVGSCLYCYVDAPRVINKLGKEAEEAGGSILDTGLGRAQAKTDRLEHNFDPEAFARMPVSVINAFNMDGGLRMFSFGDYRPEIDQANVQATLDAALERGLWIKAITKSKEFVEIFGDHPALRINISIDSVPTSVSNSWSIDEAIAAKLRYPNLRVRSVALNAEEIDAQAAMKMPDGSPLVDVITLYHGASNFTPLGVRTGKLSKLILAKMDDPEFTPPEAKKKILEQFGGRQGLEDYLDTWTNMGPKNKEHVRARNTYVGRVCCTNAKCASDPDTKCGFGIGNEALIKTIGFLLGFGAAGHPGLPEPVMEILEDQEDVDYR